MVRARHGPLLERDDLLGRLAELVGAARDGIGSVVLVAGEAGAGKTSLILALADAVNGEATVWTGHCDPLATPRPLGPLLDIAGQPGAGLEDLLEGDRQPYELFGDVLSRLRDATWPVVVIVEDAHWADDATLDLLRFLGRRIAGTHAVVAVTYRDDEVGPEHPLRAVIGDLVSQRSTERIDVDPLSADAVHTLVERAEADVDAAELHAVTGGNAFYVTEVLESGSDVPSSIQDLVASRLMRLGEGGRRVAHTVATAPRHLAVDDARELTGEGGDAIEEAIGVGLLLTDGAHLSFRHELARLAVERVTPELRRVDLHRRSLELHEAAGSDDHALLAHHAKHAGRDDLVLAHAWTAAGEAAARGAHRQAVELYADAAARCAGLSPREQVDLLASYCVELSMVDLQDESLLQARRAAAIADTTDDDELRGRARIWLGRAMWVVGDATDSGPVVEEGLSLLERGGPSEHLAYGLSTAALQSMLARHHRRAVELGERSLAMATALGDQALIRRALTAVGTPELATGDADRGIDLLLHARQLGEEFHDDGIVSYALGSLGSGGGEVRRYAQAYGWLEEAIEHARGHDLDYTAAYDQAWQARIRFEQGRWDEAAALAREPAALPPEAARVSPVTALGTIGRIRVRRGDPDPETPLRRALEIGARMELQHRWPSLCGLAEMYWLQHRPAQAVELLAGPYADALDTDSQWARGEIGYWMWRAGGIDGPAPGAAPPFAAMMAGRWRLAADAWRSIGCPYEQALALAEGDEEAMLAALAIFDRLGARPAAQWLRGRMRDAGLDSIPRGPRPSTRAHVAGLTARQAEVLALMCDGLANAEIAARLYISKKTVEHHVAAVLRKLGVSTRAEAIAAARAFE
jgi:DNA-binding CsgD family transcriptional regulator/tetratricopeptide (TPR) repeat protein